jgi:large subunit ribosomal protein L14e
MFKKNYLRKSYGGIQKMKIGDLVVKLAGRDAGKLGVVVEVIDPTYVVADGAMRRKKVNIRHIEPLGKNLTIKAKASSEDVAKVLKEAGIEVVKSKSRSAAPKQIKKRVLKAKENAEKKVAKKAVAAKKPAAKKASKK